MSRRIAAISPQKPAGAVWENHWLLGALLVLLTAVAYQRVWQCGYIWDDNFHVTQNPALRDLHGLWRIWFDVAATPQYYPLVHTSFWFEYHLWGLNATGYHCVNVVLHALSAVLLWRILTMLEMRGAWVAAAIFALHPVQVESVAWISERKNVLSGLFYFSAALLYLRFLGKSNSPVPERRTWVWYFAALALFLCALLSKTVTCSLPAALLLVQWWKSGTLKRRTVLPLLPFFAVGFCMGWGTIWIERYQVGALGTSWSFTLAERCLIAGRALCFYTSKVLWPTHFTFIYPRWTIDSTAPWQWLFPLGVAAVIAILWFGRGRFSRGPLAAVLFFAGSLSPALGFVNVFPFRYSFVADHFQYLASVGLIVFIAEGLRRLPRAIPALLLAFLAVLTWRQTAVYRDSETLWGNTLKANPDSWMVQDHFAAVLIGKGKHEEALVHLQKALEIDPNVPETLSSLGFVLTRIGRVDEALRVLEKAVKVESANGAAATHYNLAFALMLKGRSKEAVVEFEQALKIDPTYLPAETELGNALLQAGRAQDSLVHLQRALAVSHDDVKIHSYLANTLLQLGDTEEAMLHLEKVLRAHPNNPDVQKNMAWVLATTPVARVRNGAKAVELAEQASRLTNGKDAIIETTLAAAYAESGQFSKAITTAEAALRLADEMGNVPVVQLLDEQITLYRAGAAFRDQRPVSD